MRATFGWKTLFDHTKQETHLPHEFWQGKFSASFTKFLDSFLGLKTTTTKKNPTWFHSDYSKAWVWIWLSREIAHFDGKQTVLSDVSIIFLKS